MLGEVEADILCRIIDPGNPTLTPWAAQGILALSYSEADHARIADLAAKSNRGSLSPAEHRELESYVFVGDVLSMLKSEARLSLQSSTPVV